MLNVFVLGKFEVRQEKKEIRIQSRAAQTLLAYLILNPGRSHRRENLAGLLWPEASEAKARNNLRQALWRLRSAVGKTFFRTDKITIGWNPEADYGLDADTLRENLPENPSADRIMTVVSVYGGHLLPGFYDEWVIPLQKQLQGIFEDRMQLLVNQLLQEKRWRDTRHWAEWWISMGTVPEPAYGALMKAAAGLGDVVGVVAAFQRCVDDLEKEIGVAPSPETHALLQQLQDSDHPRPGNMESAASKPDVYLPMQPTPFIGRQKELGNLAALLADPGVRLITLLGPGGIGKTRLAIETAGAQLDAFPDGIYFVSLVSVNEPKRIVSQIADAIGFHFHVPNQRIRGDSEPRNNQLLTYLRAKHMLFVLDNIDALTGMAQDDTTACRNETLGLIADMLREAPSIRILATSRERLHLEGETCFMVEGLACPERSASPDPESLPSYDAIRFFTERAWRIDSRFALTAENRDPVVEICRRVGGMPLAIELAAAWVALLTPEEIAEEIRNSPDFLASDLNDIPDRHRSIRTVFDHTWNRLTPFEKKAFRQLAVFRAGFTRRAAQAVTGASVGVLKSLLDQSLIQWDMKGRYQIHELLRQFAVRKLLEASGEKTRAEDRHASFYAAFMRQKETELFGRRQAQALKEIEIDIENVLAAWRWVLSQARLKEIGLIMESLAEFYRIRGGLSEIAGLFEAGARSLGWKGYGVTDALPDGPEEFQNTMRLLEKASSIQADEAHEKDIVLGKMLACLNRFY